MTQINPNETKMSDDDLQDLVAANDTGGRNPTNKKVVTSNSDYFLYTMIIYLL